MVEWVFDSKHSKPFGKIGLPIKILVCCYLDIENKKYIDLMNKLTYFFWFLWTAEYDTKYILGIFVILHLFVNLDVTIFNESQHLL